MASDERKIFYPGGMYSLADVSAASLGKGDDLVIYCLRVWYPFFLLSGSKFF